MNERYKICSSAQFLQDQEDVFGTVARADEFVFGVDHRLSRDPYTGLHTFKNVWCVELIGGNPQVLLYYSINESKRLVTMRRLKKYEVQEEE